MVPLKLAHRGIPRYAIPCLLALSLLFSSHCAAGDASPDVLLSAEPIQPLSLIIELNLAKVALGKRLFHETHMSDSGRMACSTCHNLQSNGADGLPRAIGNDGAPMDFNTPTVFNSGLNHRQFWDGRARTLEEQIDFVMAGAVEFASSWPDIIARLRLSGEYENDFAALYPDGLTATNIRDAIATFERSLITPNSRFDRYLRGDAEAITAEEKEGYRLFKAYGCAACHQGQNVGGNLFHKLGIFKPYYTGAQQSSVSQNQGRFNVTGLEQDRNVFRVPSLRLAVLTSPYFHDGSIGSLEDAISIMEEFQLGRSITGRDIERIIAFLWTLPGEYQGQPLIRREKWGPSP